MYRAHVITIGITVTTIVFFSSLLQELGTYLSFCILSILLCGQPEQKNPLFSKFSLSLSLSLSLLLIFMMSGRLAEIRVSL